jgi:adenine-specific DNA methylase
MSASPARTDAREPRLNASFLEEAFPFAELSALARADRFSTDPTYSVHKWWARRPPAVIRALLLSATLPAATTADEFWEHYRDDDAPLEGLHVGDGFLGGATSLVEGARLGAKVTGVDVDPLAVRIAEEELAAPDAGALERAAGLLLEHLRVTLAELYPVVDGRVPLHYFYAREIDCPSCHERTLLYRNLVLARDDGRDGAVVRDSAIVAFCPDCRALHHLPKGRKTLTCCAAQRKRVRDSTYAGARFTCPHCAARATHDELRTAEHPRILLAVETTCDGRRRELRAPTVAEHAVEPAAARLLAEHGWPVPTAELGTVDSGRAGIYGFSTVADLFSARQRTVFAAAFAWARKADLAGGVRRSLLLGISNALTANNLLCGYAVDYGRLSPLFSVIRAYAMPALSIELNPLHPTAGRGTIAATLRRLHARPRDEVRRKAYDASGRLEPATFTGRRDVDFYVVRGSVDRAFPKKLGAVDIMLTDPPYYDFIAYSDFSLLHRAWLGTDGEPEELGDMPIFPAGEEPAKTFARRLGKAFQQMSSALAPDGLLTFTFHASKDEAWEALRAALAASDLKVTAVYPVWADARAGGGHGHPGNCEWDLVFVCRPARQRPPAPVSPTAEGWIAELGEDQVGEADRRGMRRGLTVAAALAPRVR